MSPVTTDGNPDGLPIDPSEPMALQSRQSLMIADSLGLLTYRMPVDMTNAAQIDTIRGELGPDVVLPEEASGVYYFVYVHTDDGTRVPVLLAEGEPRAFVLALAVRHSREAADAVLYRRSLLPA